MSKQCGRWLAVLIGSAPLWVVGDFYLFVLRAYFHLGYWPKPHQPDPKDLPFPIHYNRVGIILFLGLLTLPLVYAFTLAGLFWLKCQGAYIRWGVVTFFLSVALAIGFWFVDPGDYLLWYFD